MNKEELLRLLETLEIKEIKSIELEFYKENCYGFGYDNRELTKIVINKENK